MPLSFPTSEGTGNIDAGIRQEMELLFATVEEVP